MVDDKWGYRKLPTEATSPNSDTRSEEPWVFVSQKHRQYLSLESCRDETGIARVYILPDMGRHHRHRLAAHQIPPSTRLFSPSALCSTRVNPFQGPLIWITSAGGSRIVPLAPFAQKKSGETTTLSPSLNLFIRLVCQSRDLFKAPRQQ